MRKKYLKCVGDGYFDCTEGKTYEVFKEDRDTQGVDYYFLDDVGYTCMWSPSSETGDFQLVADSPQFPVGTQCQARTQQNGFWCRWKDITVMGYYEDLIWFSHGDTNFTGELSQVELREKNSEREHYVEKAAPILYHSYEPDEKGMELLAGHLYDLGFKLPDEET